MRTLAAGMIACMLLASPASADTVVLKDGRSMEGFVISRQDGELVLDIGIGKIKFLEADVLRVEPSGDEESVLLRGRWQAKREADEVQAKLAERQPKTVSIAPTSVGVMVDVLLNGRVRVKMLLDTGATHVLISRNVARELGIDVDHPQGVMPMQVADGRMVQVMFTTLESVRVEDSEALSVAVAVPLDDATVSYGDGLLGMSFLSHFNFTISQKDKRLVLEKL